MVIKGRIAQNSIQVCCRCGDGQYIQGAISPKIVQQVRIIVNEANLVRHQYPLAARRI